MHYCGLLEVAKRTVGEAWTTTCENPVPTLGEMQTDDVRSMIPFCSIDGKQWVESDKKMGILCLKIEGKRERQKIEDRINGIKKVENRSKERGKYNR